MQSDNDFDEHVRDLLSRVTILTARVGITTFEVYRRWLEHHCSGRWQVKYLEETGVRTSIKFDSPRDKFLFDIAFAKDVLDSEKLSQGAVGWLDTTQR